MDQPGKVANPGRGQLNRENEYCSFSILRLNLVLTHRIPPDFRAASIYLFKPPYATIGSVPS